MQILNVDCIFTIQCLTYESESGEKMSMKRKLLVREWLPEEPESQFVCWIMSGRGEEIQTGSFPCVLLSLFRCQWETLRLESQFQLNSCILSRLAVGGYLHLLLMTRAGTGNYSGIAQGMETQNRGIQGIFFKLRKAETSHQ